MRATDGLGMLPARLLVPVGPRAYSCFCPLRDANLDNRAHKSDVVPTLPLSFPQGFAFSVRNDDEIFAKDAAARLQSAFAVTKTQCDTPSMMDMLQDISSRVSVPRH